MHLMERNNKLHFWILKQKYRIYSLITENVFERGKKGSTKVLIVIVEAKLPSKLLLNGALLLKSYDPNVNT